MKGPVVVKVGGARLINREDLLQLARYIGWLQEAKRRPVIVHGGGPEIGTLHERLGVPFELQLGLRVTSDESMNLVSMVLGGLVNTRVVATLVEEGLPAVGLTGADLGMMRSRMINERALGRVGGPPQIDTSLIEELLASGRVPVVAPVSVAPDGGLVNVNADSAAQSLAISLAAESLELVTDVPAVKVQGRAVRTLRPTEVANLVDTQEVTGGMIPKLQASVAAVGAGVERVTVGTFESFQNGTATEVRA